MGWQTNKRVKYHDTYITRIINLITANETRKTQLRTFIVDIILMLYSTYTYTTNICMSVDTHTEIKKWLATRWTICHFCFIGKQVKNRKRERERGNNKKKMKSPWNSLDDGLKSSLHFIRGLIQVSSLIQSHTDSFIHSILFGFNYKLLSVQWNLSYFLGIFPRTTDHFFL